MFIFRTSKSQPNPLLPMARNPYQWRRIVNDYFIFSKGQRRAVIVLCSLIFLLFLLPAIHNYFFDTATTKSDPVLIEQVAGLKVYNDTTYKNESAESADYSAYSKPTYKKSKETRRTLFPFDPNT